MITKYRKEILLLLTTIVFAVSTFAFIRVNFFGNVKVNKPINDIKEYLNESENEIKYGVATTKPVKKKNQIFYDGEIKNNEPEKNEETSYPYSNEEISYPYSMEPLFYEDGSIIYDGLTLTELTDKLNRSLGSYLTNTGYFFAKFTKDTGMDPYLSVAIVLLETGCKWTCSSLTRNCNNIGGLKGHGSCNGGSYSKYDSLEEGISGYLNVIYNNYYLRGKKTPEQMASSYAASNTWAMKVNKYINEIKAK